MPIEWAGFADTIQPGDGHYVVEETSVGFVSIAVPAGSMYRVAYGGSPVPGNGGAGIAGRGRRRSRS